MITVLGSINMDLIATVDRLPKPGETVPGNGFSTAAGGKGANQALAARRAGSGVHMAGAVGGDSFAGPALELLAAEGADLAQVAKTDSPTGIAMILVGGDGENVIAVVPGANGTINVAQAEAAIAAMQQGDILMVQLEIPPATVEAALMAARRRGIVTIINLAPIIPQAVRLSRMADIVIANETEFELLAGKQRLDGQARERELARLHSDTNQTFIVTLGADGVVAIANGEILRATGLNIQPVDTVGAGDTFCGYLAAGLDQRLALKLAIKRAAIAGSLACLKPGAQPSIPRVSEVDAAMA